MLKERVLDSRKKVKHSLGQAICSGADWWNSSDRNGRQTLRILRHRSRFLPRDCAFVAATSVRGSLRRTNSATLCLHQHQFPVSSCLKGVPFGVINQSSPNLCVMLQISPSDRATQFPRPHLNPLFSKSLRSSTHLPMDNDCARPLLAMDQISHTMKAYGIRQRDIPICFPHRVHSCTGSSQVKGCMFV